MSERSAVTDGGTVAWVFRDVEEAEAGARRLRAAGFPDVRLSEGAGTTTEAHVAESVGLTATDFAATLEKAGFARHDARRLTDGVARGGALVTLAAGSDTGVARALAVLRGETVAAQTLSPVDIVPATVVSAAPVAPVAPAATVAPAGTASPFVASPADTRTLELREERLEVEKQATYSEARIRKETVTEERTITVPVQHERLVIERDGEAPIHIPISGDP